MNRRRALAEVDRPARHAQDRHSHVAREISGLVQRLEEERLRCFVRALLEGVELRDGARRIVFVHRAFGKLDREHHILREHRPAGAIYCDRDSRALLGDVLGLVQPKRALAHGERRAGRFVAKESDGGGHQPKEQDLAWDAQGKHGPRTHRLSLILRKSRSCSRTPLLREAELRDRTDPGGDGRCAWNAAERADEGRWIVPVAPHCVL